MVRRVDLAVPGGPTPGTTRRREHNLFAVGRPPPSGARKQAAQLRAWFFAGRPPNEMKSGSTFHGAPNSQESERERG